MGSVVNTTPRPLYPRERHPVPRMLGGPQSRSGQVRNISPPLGFESRTEQAAAIRCTDWAFSAYESGKVDGGKINLREFVFVMVKTERLYNERISRYENFSSRTSVTRTPVLSSVKLFNEMLCY